MFFRLIFNVILGFTFFIFLSIRYRLEKLERNLDTARNLNQISSTFYDENHFISFHVERE